MSLLSVDLCLPLSPGLDERETGWSKAETDYLFRLLNDYALRFYIVADRYEWPGSERHVEDLKARYYAICRKLFKVRPTEQENRNTGTVQYGFDYGVFCPLFELSLSNSVLTSQREEQTRVHRESMESRPCDSGRGRYIIP